MKTGKDTNKDAKTYYVEIAKERSPSMCVDIVVKDKNRDYSYHLLSVGKIH